MIQCLSAMIFDFHTHAAGAAYYATLESPPLFVQSLMWGVDTPSNTAPLLSLGIHPMQSNVGDLYERFRFDPQSLLVNFSECVKSLGKQHLYSVGECGFDRRSPLSLDAQSALVRLQLTVADELSLPVVWHCVGAVHLLLQLRKEYPYQEWWVHGFRGKQATLDQLLQAHIGVSIRQPIALFTGGDETAFSHPYCSIPSSFLRYESDFD